MRVCMRVQNVWRETGSLPPPALLPEDGSGGTGDVILQYQCDLDDCPRARRRDKGPGTLRVALTRRLKQLQFRRLA